MQKKIKMGNAEIYTFIYISFPVRLPDPVHFAKITLDHNLIS